MGEIQKDALATTALAKKHFLTKLIIINSSAGVLDSINSSIALYVKFCPRPKGFSKCLGTNSAIKK